MILVCYFSLSLRDHEAGTQRCQCYISGCGNVQFSAGVVVVGDPGGACESQLGGVDGRPSS
jgi:hypothetical protein